MKTGPGSGSAECWDPATGVWWSLPPMGQPRADAAGCASHGRWSHHAPTFIGACSKAAAAVVVYIFEHVLMGVGA